MESNVSSIRSLVNGVACALLLTLSGLSGSPAGATPAPPVATPVVTPPNDPADVRGWLAWMQAEELPALPHAATLVYRLGHDAARRGDNETAVRLWRGAEELDPTYLAPRLRLAGHFFSRDPAQALIEIGRIVGLARMQFRLQHHFTSYVLFYALSALYLATIAVALLLCWRHRDRLRHVYAELLQRRMPEPRARAWATVGLLLPWAFGLGVAIPATFTLAMLWGYLKKTERMVFIGLTALLVTSPIALSCFGELSLPLREGEPPFYSTLRVPQQPYSAGRMAELSALAAQLPDNPFLAFAEGWTAQKGKQYDAAVIAYRRAEELWPREARIPNNLGNIETLRGNGEAAEMHYKRAIMLSPRWAPPRYNLGQLYTARFRYAEASEEIAQATALDFDLVRSLQARASSSEAPALAEEWLEPSVQWPAVFAAGAADEGADAVPPAWRPWFESRGLPVAVWTLVFAAIGLGAGLVLRHHLPARICGNCGSTVCRRCATRRRDSVLCVACSAVVGTATTPEFGRLLLFKRRRETRRRQDWIRLALAAVVPGYGAIAFDRVLTGWAIAAAAALAGLLAFGGTAPFPYDPRVLVDASRPGAMFALSAFAVVYSISLLSTLSWQGRARENEIGLESSAGKPVARIKRAA